MIAWLRVLIVPMLLLSCSEQEQSQPAGPKKKKQRTEPTVEFVSDKELAQMKSELDAEVTLSAASVCERPVLRGTPIAGSADLELKSILELTGSLAPCTETVKAAEAGFTAGTDLGGNLEEVYAPDALEAVVTACAPLPELLHQAVSHLDGCSPVLVGRRPFPYESGLQGIRAVRALAGRWAREGRTRSAIEFLLDYLRFGQDLSRGSSLLEAMISTAITKGLVPDISLLLGSPGLKASELAAIQKEIEILLKGQISLQGMIRGEYLSTIQYTMRPDLEKPDWLPLGAISRGGPAPSPPDWEERQTLTLGWLTFKELRDDRLKACPDIPVSWKSCIEQQEALETEHAREAKKQTGDLVMDMFTLAAKNPTTDEARALVRAPMIATLKTAAAGSLVKYLRRMAGQEAMLLALEAQVSAQLGVCPSVPNKGRLGVALETTADKGEFVIKKPEWLRSGPDDDTPLVRYRCASPQGELDAGKEIK